jgi:5-methylthioadenosine/S-adenosylhomocysteine deaminase
MEPSKVLLRGGTIITADPAGTIIAGASLLIERNKIAEIFLPGTSLPPLTECEIVDVSKNLVIPGFIQTHLHLCQTLFRGRADDLELLGWLKHKIFPFEAAHNPASMHASAMMGIAELVRSGTTTILDMGSIHHEEEIIRAIGESGMRAFVGKAMMDVNDLYPSLKESTEQSLSTTRQLTEQWHNSFDGRVRYAMAPRFVLSCTDKLLQGTREMLTQYTGVLFHTHASENLGEIQAVRERTGVENIVFLNRLGLLSNRACLAHCVHLNEDEIGILSATGTNVAHCPSSNLKLGSGIAGIPGLMSKNINVSLGADGAPCNNSLDMFQEMRLASLIQKPFHGSTSMSAKNVFEMATRNGAKALGMEHEIGSIEVGKKADIVVLDLNNVWDPVNPSEQPYSGIVYSATPENVDSVMIDGRWIYRKKEFAGLDEHSIVAEARVQLGRLLERIH